MLRERQVQRRCFSWIFIMILTVGLLGLSQAALANGDQAAAFGVDLVPPLDDSVYGPKDDAAGDPEGLIGIGELDPVIELARKLSKQRWLTPEIQASLDDLSLKLHETFEKAPRYIVKDGVYLELLLDKIGDQWGDFDWDLDPYVVFITHEINSDFGDDRVLGFINGEERLFSEADLKSYPAVGLAVNAVGSEEIDQKSSAATIELGLSRIELGEVRLKVNRDKFPSFELDRFEQKSQCVHEAALAACGSTGPICAPGSEPFFVLEKVMIRTDHEGVFRGSPEYEKFLFTAEGFGDTPPLGAKTKWIFDGRTILDDAGRKCSLLDVNRTNQWYDIGSCALLSFEDAKNWVGADIEDDKIQGDLRTTAFFKKYKTKVFTSAGGYFFQRIDFGGLNFPALYKAGILIKNAIVGDGDDVFDDPVGVTSALACTSGLSRGTPRSLILDGGESAMQGYFACINPTCAPLDVKILGSRLVTGGARETYDAKVTSGVGPFTINWYRKSASTGNIFLGSGPSVTIVTEKSFWLICEVTDGAGQTAKHEINIRAEDPSDCAGNRCNPR